MPSVSNENEAPAKAMSSFRQSVGSISKKSQWVSPFRNQLNTEANTRKTEKHEKLESSDAVAPATKKQKVEGDKASADRTINPKDLEKRLEALSTTADASTNKKIKPEDRMVDLGGGLKMSQVAIDKIARERLGKDLEKINEKASAQQKLRELKHQKKLELQALKDQNKVNSRFAKFKRKLDLEKKSIKSEHDRKVKEIEASLASLDKEIKDFDKKTKTEVEQAGKDAELEKQNADKKLVEDKEKTAQEAANLEKEHLQTVHDHQINQKRTEITSRVLHAKQSEYELELELLELKLAQSSRELTKQKDHNSAHTAIKDDLEAQIATAKQAIAENTAKIEKSESTQLESARSLKSAEGELESSRETVESLKTQLAELKAGRCDRDLRLQEAIAQRKIHDEEQERLRKEAEERARIAEEERLRKEAEEKQRQAEEAERLRLEEEERERQEEEEKRLAEEERQRKLAEEEKLRKEQEEKLRLEAEEKKKQHELAVSSFGDDLTSRKEGLDKEIEAKKSSNANADEIALLQLERKHLDGWTYENQDSKTKELNTSIALTKKDQEARAKIVAKEAKKKAAAAEKEEKKRAALLAKEEKKRAENEAKEEKRKSVLAAKEEKRKATAEKEAKDKKSITPIALGATAITAGAAGAASGSAPTTSTIQPAISNKAVPETAPIAKSAAPVVNSNAPVAESCAPVAESTIPVVESTSSAPVVVPATIPLAKSTIPIEKSTASLTKQSSPKDKEATSRRSSFFGGLFKKKNKEEKSVSPEPQTKKKHGAGALGAAEATTVGAGVVGAGSGVAGLTSNGVSKAASLVPGGPIATSNDAATNTVKTSTEATSTSTEPESIVGSTEAVKDEIPAALPVEKEFTVLDTSEIVSTEKATEIDEEPSTLAQADEVTSAQEVSPVEQTSEEVALTTTTVENEATPGAQIIDGRNIGGSDIEQVTGTEFQTSVVEHGSEPIFAVTAADPNITLEEITLEQAKHEDDVLAVVAAHDSTLQEVERSELSDATEQAHSQDMVSKYHESQAIFDQEKDSYTAPTTADRIEGSKAEITEPETAELSKTPFNESSNVEPAITSAPNDHSEDLSKAPLAVAAGLKSVEYTGNDTAALNKGEHVEPKPVAIPDEQKLKVVEGVLAPKLENFVEPLQSTDPVESSSTLNKEVVGIFAAVATGSLGTAVISKDGPKEDEIPKAAQELVDSSAPNVVKASEPQTLPHVAPDDPSFTLNPVSSAQAISTDDYNTSREATPEPGVVVAAVSSSTSKGKNAKKNKKKREAAKNKKKMTAAGAESESSPEPEFAPARSIDATTAVIHEKKDDNISESVGITGGIVAGVLTNAAAAVGLKSEEKRDETKDAVNSEEKSASLPTGYNEPEPVAIPAEQKLKVKPGVSQETAKDAPVATEPESAKGAGFVETAAIVGVGAAITGVAVFEAAKEKVVNAVSGEEKEEKSTDATSNDTKAAVALTENKDESAKEIDAEYYSLDPKNVSKRYSQNEPDEPSTTVGESSSITATDEKKDSDLLATASGVGVAGVATAATKPAPAVTTPKKAATAVEQPKSGKKFGFKKFWKSDKKDVKPLSATTTPVKKARSPELPSTKSKEDKVKVSEDTPLKEAEVSDIDPSNATKATTGVITGDEVEKSESTSKEVDDTPLMEADVSDFDPSKATFATTGIVSGTLAGPTGGTPTALTLPKEEFKVGDRSTPAAAAVPTAFDKSEEPKGSNGLVQGDNDSLYSYREIYVYEEVTGNKDESNEDEDDEGLISKAVKAVENVATTII